VIVLDTSVWLGAILPEDVHFAETQLWIHHIQLTRTRFAVPAHFPAEVSGVLARIGIDDRFVEEVIKQIDSIERFEIYPISAGHGLLAAEIAWKARVRGADAIYIALAHQLDVPLVSWDRQQRERGQMFCRTMTPVEAMELDG
jgi:predicted nucleic acid-binding protein